MGSFSGWLTRCSRLKVLEKRFIFLDTSLQVIQDVSKLGAENSIRSLKG
jgi:hypothetical protein